MCEPAVNDFDNVDELTLTGREERESERNENEGKKSQSKVRCEYSRLVVLVVGHAGRRLVVKWSMVVKRWKVVCSFG